MPKKETDLDKLARLVAEGFVESASKTDLQAIREESRRNTERVLHAIDGLELKMSAHGSSWKQDYDRLTFLEKREP